MPPFLEIFVGEGGQYGGGGDFENVLYIFSRL
jgi:hypothetical protein